MDANVRSLNTYESMLATSTCNVGLIMDLAGSWNRLSPTNFQESVRQAWRRTVSENRFLQLKLVEGTTLLEIEKGHESNLLQFRKGEFDLVNELQRIGTTALNCSDGLYHVDILLNENSAQAIFSFCHAVSDGPGSLHVVQSFLDNLDAVMSDNHDHKPSRHLEAIDLQARLLGEDYGISESARDVFEHLAEYRAAIDINSSRGDMDSCVLPPEGLQGIPRDPTGPGSIQCVKFSLSKAETSKLRETCRLFGSTVQGALVAAAFHARVTLLELQLPLLAAVQIPVNTRKLAHVQESECLCASAGVWHTVTITDDIWGVAAKSTKCTHDSLNTQPKEWLRRLFHAPQTLPPYSLMVSSMGVAPIENKYNHFQIKQLLFFGGALHTSRESQGTMVHALTFDGELNGMVNFTSPGVSKRFAQKTASLMKNSLQSMGNT